MAKIEKKWKLKGLSQIQKSSNHVIRNKNQIKVTSIVISTQHSKELNQDQVRELIIPYIKKSIPSKFLKSLKMKRNIYKSNRSIYHWWSRW